MSHSGDIIVLSDDGEDVYTPAATTNTNGNYIHDGSNGLNYDSPRNIESSSSSPTIGNMGHDLKARERKISHGDRDGSSNKRVRLDSLRSSTPDAQTRAKQRRSALEVNSEAIRQPPSLSSTRIDDHSYTGHNENRIPSSHSVINLSSDDEDEGIITLPETRLALQNQIKGNSASNGIDNSPASSGDMLPQKPEMPPHPAKKVQLSSPNASFLSLPITANNNKAQASDSDSDDEIMELDPEEAARTGLFNKPSSFRQTPIDVDAMRSLTPVPISVGQELQIPHMQHRSQSPSDGTTVDLLSNQPFDTRPDPYSPYQRRAMAQRELFSLDTQHASLRGNYEAVNSACLKLASDLRSHIEQLNDSKEKIQMKSHQLSAIADSDLAAREQVLSEVQVDARNFESRKRTLEVATAQLNFKRREREALLNSIRNLAEKRKALVAEGISYIENVSNPYGVFNDMVTSPSNNRQGYSNNIYSNAGRAGTDEVDLADLLNNIKPVELEEKGMALTPLEMSVQLLKHQRIGLSWLLRMERGNHKGGILADAMGLGKTVQTIALMMANKSTDETCKTTLIIGPVSLLRQWAAEIESKLKPDVRLKIGIFHGSSKKQMANFRQMRSFDVIMTSYGTLSSEFKKHYRSAIETAKVTKNQDLIPDLDSGGVDYASPFFSEGKFFRIILDEAQNIKNKLSFASKAVACLKGVHKFCLSGTPMQNNVDELFPLLRFLGIKPYNEQRRFNVDISNPIKSKSQNYDKEDRDRSMRKLRAVLSAILLRRTKDSKIDGKPILTLPEKHVNPRFVKMDDDELKYYKDLEQGIQNTAKRLLNSKAKGSSSSILALLLRLRQACIHRFLVDIGEMNAAERENAVDLTPAAWRMMYKRASKFDKETVIRIKSALHNGSNTDTGTTPAISNNRDDDLVDPADSDAEALFTCPICFDVRACESLVIFASCGHMICSSCTENFFEDNEEGDGGLPGSRVASCFSCSKSVKENEIINHTIFHKVHYEHCDEFQLDSYYNDLLKKSRKTTNKQKIDELISQEDGFMPSAKMDKALELIKDVFAKYPDEKIILFSQFTASFDLLKLILDHENIPFLRYDGSMTVDSKNATIKEFYQGNRKVMLLSLKAGNVGLTLTCASHVILLDPFWNPFVEEQAMDRAHRIGQQSEVHVHRILIEGTVESRIMDLQDKKKEVIEAALDEKGMQGVSRLGRRELGFLFGLNTLT